MLTATGAESLRNVARRRAASQRAMFRTATFPVPLPVVVKQDAAM
jgi:hypothetical protein